MFVGDWLVAERFKKKKCAWKKNTHTHTQNKIFYTKVGYHTQKIKMFHTKRYFTQK